MKHRKLRKKAAWFAAAMLLVLGALYGGLRLWEDMMLAPGQTPEAERVSRTITKDGVDYYPRRDITVLLLLGFDQSAADAGSPEEAMLLIFDQKAETWGLLELGADTVAGLTVTEDRCVDICRAVSELLGGVTIDHYFALTMDAVADLNGGDALERMKDYGSAASCLETDCPVSTLLSMAARYQDYGFTGVIRLEDQGEALEELILGLFYAPK